MTKFKSFPYEKFLANSLGSYVSPSSPNYGVTLAADREQSLHIGSSSGSDLKCFNYTYVQSN